MAKRHDRSGKARRSHPTQWPTIAGKKQVVATGLAFGESPRWHEGHLWVADWGTREILRVREQSGLERILALPQGPFQPISIDWLSNGSLVIVASKERLLLRAEADGSLETFADLTQIFDRGLNEIVVDGRGNTYVNGAGFDLMAGEQFKPGGIAVVTSDDEARRVADGLAFPNGMAVTRDNSALIVAESYAKKLTAFDIDRDGSLSNRHTWAALGDGAPDGICLDAEGSIWYADVPNKRCVRVREGGEILQVIELDRGCFACALGGTEGRTLFMVTREWRGVAGIIPTAGTGQVVAVTAPAPRAGWP